MFNTGSSAGWARWFKNARRVALVCRGNACAPCPTGPADATHLMPGGRPTESDKSLSACAFDVPRRGERCGPSVPRRSESLQRLSAKQAQCVCGVEDADVAESAKIEEIAIPETMRKACAVSAVASTRSSSGSRQMGCGKLAGSTITERRE